MLPITFEERSILEFTCLSILLGRMGADLDIESQAGRLYEATVRGAAANADDPRPESAEPYLIRALGDLGSLSSLPNLDGGQVLLDHAERFAGEYNPAQAAHHEAILDFAISSTAILYRDDGPDIDALKGGIDVEWRWCKRPIGPRLRSVGGRTAVVRGRPLVQISVCTRHLDREALLSVLYVILHEFVCHAARFLCGAPEPTERSSAFTEGWMDVVALTTHNSSLTAAPGVLAWCDVDCCMNAARRTHDTRFTIDDVNYSLCSGRITGQRVAQELRRRLGSEAFCALSARICSANVTDLAVDTFTLHLDEILRGDSEICRSVLRALQSDRDVDALLTFVEQIWVYAL